MSIKYFIDIQNMRLVVTMTTLPGREDLIIETVKSIINQTVKPEAIYLTLPKISRRLKIPYGPIPDEIKDYCTIVEPDIDYGPITKIYGGLSMESDPETIIISCDDDMIYPPTTFELLVEKSKLHPDAAICGSGMLMGYGVYFNSTYTNYDEDNHFIRISGFVPPPEGRRVDIVNGLSGVLYKRRFFPSMDECIKQLFELAISDHDILCNDDILISGFLQKNGITRMTFPGFPKVINRAQKGNHPEVALSFNGMETLNRTGRAISKLSQQGYFTEYEPVGVDETMAGVIIIGSLILILLVCLVVVMWVTLDRPITSNRFQEIFYI
jgi:hypothetical protein